MGERFLRLKEDSALQARILEVLLETHEKVVRDVNKTTILLNHLLLTTSSSAFMVDAMECLLERGANPNTKNGVNGGTPLHRAVVLRRDVRRCNEDGIKLLLRFGAKVDLCDKEGNMVIDWAKERGDATALQILAEYN
jgi:ankyrin repeat protein